MLSDDLKKRLERAGIPYGLNALSSIVCFLTMNQNS